MRFRNGKAKERASWSPCLAGFALLLPSDASARSKESIEKMENIKSVELSWRQLAEHNKEGDAWLAIRGQVYDVTSWVNAHPGGKDTILLNAVRHLSHQAFKHSFAQITICAQNLRSNFGYAIASRTCSNCPPIYTSIVWASSIDHT